MWPWPLARDLREVIFDLALCSMSGPAAAFEGGAAGSKQTGFISIFYLQKNRKL